MGRALIALGFETGDRLGVLGFNRAEWTQSALGAMWAGGAAAGIYTTNAPRQVRFILEHSGARAVVVENAHQLAKVTEVRGDLPDLTHVVVMDPEGVDEDDSVLGWQTFLERGHHVLGSTLDERQRALAPEHLATLIYTSGTTGEPKGVMLSHGNALETVKMTVEAFGLRASDSGLSYLPLAHVAEQMMTIFMPSYTGCSIYYAEAPEKVAENLREVRPTVLFGVPRVWERFHSGLCSRLADAPASKQRMAEWAFEVGRDAMAVEFEGGRCGAALAVKRRLADKLVAAKVRSAIGFDRLRLAATGAAPIAREVLGFFSGLGIPIYEVYGLSESSGPATWSQPGRTRLGTVGQPLGSVEIRLADDGEVLIRGPNVFMGYLNNPEATAESLEDGWLHSGDLGAFDDDGYLTITGRKKNLLITSGGKNIAPEGLETALKQLDLLSEAVVVGDARRFVAALVTLDEEAAARFAREHGIAEDAELHREPKILEAVEAAIGEVNQSFSRVEAIREFRLLPRLLSVEEGELTPTLKVKRRVVHEHFAELIEEMYAE